MNVSIAVALVAYAAGTTLLQWAPRLPPAPGWLALVVVFLTATVWRLAHARHARVQERVLLAAVLALAALLAGFFYAAWRAESRLADALPVQWETRDIRVTGIVDDLPQNGDDGARFAFAVERVDTAGAYVPRRVSLAWHASRIDDEDGAPPPLVHAGERWRLVVRLKRPHGNVNPDGFDLEAWLLEHDLRATGYVRDASGERARSAVRRPPDRSRAACTRAHSGAHR